MRAGIAATLLAMCATLGACRSEVPDAGLDQWAFAGGDRLGWRFRGESAFDEQSLSRLGLAFEFRDFVVRGRTHRGVEATPLMIGRTLYFTGPWGEIGRASCRERV